MDLNLIVAVGKNGVIGKNGDLIWHIPEDLRRFKSLTLGHPVIMGRKTWESLPKKPLPGRRNIVVTRQNHFEAPGAEPVNSLDKALEITNGENPFVIGGAQIYNEILPRVTRVYLTEIDCFCKDADSYLEADFYSDDWLLEDLEEWRETPGGLRYRYVTFTRKRP